jgi:hypothetical protein
MLVHASVGRLVAVGPFDSPNDLDRWWRWHGEVLAAVWVVCVPAALTTAPAEATGDGR